MIKIHRIILNNISKKYSTKEVLIDINLKVLEGEFIAIKGESGVGKSTLLNIIAGLEPPTFGEYIFNGIEMHKQTLNQLSIIRGTDMGYISQYTPMISKLSAFENITFPLLSKKAKKSKIISILNELSEYLKVNHLLNQKINKLSGGERQRIGIIRALINNPKLLIADEPTAALDDENSNLVFNLFDKASKSGTTVIIASHSYLSSSYCRRELYLSQNRLFED